jgi:hypothetical protein
VTVSRRIEFAVVVFSAVGFISFVAKWRAAAVVSYALVFSLTLWNVARKVPA